MNTHPIKVATRRTGLSSHTIRIWEKRYGAVSPACTETNRRLYSDDDITRLQLLHQATQGGHSIGQIVHLSDADLYKLIAQPQALPQSALEQAYMEQALTSIRQLAAAALEGQLVCAGLDLGHARLVEHVVEPLMREVCELWHQGALCIADEHLASSVVRRFVDGIRMGLQPSADAPHLIVTTPDGQVHEISALLVSTLAAAANWRVTYMGPELPADQIAVPAQHNNARAVALSIVYPLDDPALGQELLKLREKLGNGISIIAGGRAVASYTNILQRIGAIQLRELTQLRPQLYALHITDNPN